MRVGDKIKVQEQCPAWLKGVVLSTGLKGIFPKSYVKTSARLQEDSDEVMEELATALWEWTGLLKTYYSVRASAACGRRSWMLTNACRSGSYTSSRA